jgi:hypothetical protein
METKTSLETTNWQLIALLSALAGFVILSWKVYDHYNILLLEKAQLTEWINPLTRWQVYLSLCIPPIAGGLADYFTTKGKNYLFITICMGVTAMLFIATATLSGDSFVKAQSILPIMMILWMTGMYLFFSPAMMLIEKSAEKTHLPIAVGIIIFVGDLIYALSKNIIHLVESLGSAWIFAGAGVALALIGYLYNKFSKQLSLHSHPDHPADPIVICLPRAFAIGLIGGACKSLIKLDSQQYLSHYLPFVDMLGSIIFISAFVVLGLGFLSRKQSSVKILLTGVIFNISGLLLTLLVSSTLLSYISLSFIILGLSMVSLSIYSVALMRVPEMKYNLAFGLFYAGFSLSGIILNALLHS